MKASESAMVVNSKAPNLKRQNFGCHAPSCGAAAQSVRCQGPEDKWGGGECGKGCERLPAVRPRVRVKHDRTFLLMGEEDRETTGHG